MGHGNLEVTRKKDLKGLIGKITMVTMQSRLVHMEINSTNI